MYNASSPGSGELQIGIALVLEDRFSNQAREASSAIRELHSEAKQLTDANLSAVRSMASMGAAAGMVTLGFISKTIQQGAGFIDTMTMVDNSVKKTGVSMDQLASKAMDVGKATMFTSQDVANAMRQMAMAGVNSKEIYNSISAVANLAGATMTQMGGENGASSILVNVMRQFRIEATEQNMAHVADILALGAARANMTLNDLAESMKYGGSTIKNLGGTLEEATAMFGVMGNVGIRGSMAGTAIANMYRYFARSVAGENKKGYEALLSLGFHKQDFIDANGNLKDMGTSMARIGAAAKSLGNVEFFNDLVKILGVRGERAGTALASSFTTYKDLLEQINNSQGFAEKGMDKRMNNLAGSIDKVTSSFETLSIRFSQSLAPVIIPFLNRVMDILNVLTAIFQVPILGSFLSGLISAIVLVGTLRLGFFALKAASLLMFNSSTVSLKNMFAVMQGGWRGATLSAEQYQATEAAIIAQRKAGFFAEAGMGAAAGAAENSFRKSAANALWENQGVWQGAYMYKNGRFWQKTPGEGIGFKRIKKEEAFSGLGQQMKGANPGMPSFGATVSETMVGGAVAGGTMRGIRTAFGAGSFAGFFKNIAMLVRGGSILRVIGAGLKGISFILGGPVGIGITLIATFLPSIINGISGLISSNNDNTDAIDANTDQQIKQQTSSDALTSDEKNELLIQTLNNLNRTISSQKNLRGNVTINLDSKLIKQQVVDWINDAKKSNGR